MPGFPTPDSSPPRDPSRQLEWLRRLAFVVSNIMQGKMNCVASVTLAANAATTVVPDIRCGADSFVGLMPRTANAAAEIGAGTIYVSARGQGTFTLAHANNAQVDRHFTYCIIG